MRSSPNEYLVEPLAAYSGAIFFRCIIRLRLRGSHCIMASMTLNLHTSNQLDILAGTLAEITRIPAASPLEPEVIVVQSRGMARWLSLHLAGQLGICANCIFPFPNAFFTQTVQASLPDRPDTAAFEREALAWRIMGLLPHIDLPSPKAYLQGDTGLKLYQLSSRVADLFDQYAIYRPEMLAAWEKGKLCYENDGEELWQAQLWRGLMAQNRGAHRRRLLDDFLTALQKDPALSSHIAGHPPKIDEQFKL